MYVMNDIDRAAAMELFADLRTETEREAMSLYKENPCYYTDALLKEGKDLLSAASQKARADDISGANIDLLGYLNLMKRNVPDFHSVDIRKTTRMGDPHYFGQVVLRERRAAYVLNSYRLADGVDAGDFCNKYDLNIMLCGSNSMQRITGHIRPDPRFPFTVGKAYRIRCKKRDDAFYEFMEKEGYRDQDIQYVYNATVNPSMLGIICDGMRFEGGDSSGLLFGAGGYFTRYANKAAGYSSLSGSRWRKGDSNKGYICLYKVLSKNPLHLDKNSASGSKKFDKVSIAPYDMVWAHKGYRMGPGRSLKASEQIVYDERQVSLMYVIEIQN